MPELHTHKCIKQGCVNTYEDEDVEAYYCASCIEERKQFTKEIDAKHASIPKERVQSDLQIAMEKGQRKNGALFVKATDLGLFI